MTLQRLQRVEINLLKHLVMHSPLGNPILVPEKFCAAFVPLWRLGLIHIWYRQDRETLPRNRNQFISLTMDGHRRINSVVANTPEFESRRLAGFQGRRKSHD